MRRIRKNLYPAGGCTFRRHKFRALMDFYGAGIYEGRIDYLTWGSLFVIVPLCDF